MLLRFNCVIYGPYIIGTSESVTYNLKSIVHVLAQAVVLKYHRLGSLNNRHPFLTVLQAEKSKVKVPADSVLSEGPLPGLQRPPSHCVLTW